MTQLRRGPWLALVLIFAVIWFGALDYRKLIKPDEGRYAEIPREMVASGDWTTPRLNGIKYFEKPPLQYWATATAYSAFGEHEWTARLWSALTGFLGILVTGFAAARLFNPATGLVAAAVLAGSQLWNAIGHVNTLDMGVSFFLCAAVFALCMGQRDDLPATESRRWQDGSWALLGLAVLSKGLIGLVLPAATVVAYSLWQRDWRLILRLGMGRGLLWLLLITAPWFIAVSLANPEFARFFFIHEHFERFLTKTHGRYQPMWYFIPILLIGITPWLGSLVQGLRRGFDREAGQVFQPSRFLLVWIIVVFSFFSASGSKLASYILPLFPALAVLIARHLMQLSPLQLGRQGIPAMILGALCLALIPFAPRLASSPHQISLYQNYLPWLYLAAALLLAGGIGCWVLARRQQTLAAIIALATGGLLCGHLVLLGHNSLSPTNSGHDIAMAVRDRIPPDAPFYSVDTYDQTLQFYLRRTTTMVAYRDELSFGIDHEPEKFIPDLETFARTWQTQPQAWALMPLDVYARFVEEGLPMQEAARDSRRVIVRKP